MAKVQKAILTEYTNDGSVVMSNIRKGKADLPVIGSNETYSATLVTEWYDGSPMSDFKADGFVYLKYKGTEYPNYTGSYFRVNLPNFGELFLEKDTVAQMRALSSTEILLLKMGYYKGVTLNGYYEAGDTPAPIEYYLSDTAEEDDGGSVIDVGGIKLGHDFIGKVDIRYFGASVNQLDNTPFINKAIIKCTEIFISKGIYVCDAHTVRGDLTRGIKVVSNRVITIDEEAILKVLPNDQGRYHLFDIVMQDNIMIIGGNMQGDRYEHLSSSGRVYTMMESEQTLTSSDAVYSGIVGFDVVSGGVMPVELPTITTLSGSANITFTPSGGSSVTMSIGDTATVNGVTLRYTERIGEWGHGIHLWEATNVVVRNVKLDQFWGDSIYLGGKDGTNLYNQGGITSEDEAIPCRNVTIDNVNIDDSRRQGISLTCATDVKILNTNINKTNGAMPQALIDIEPNRRASSNPTQDRFGYVSNVIIDNCNFTNGATQGVTFYHLSDTDYAIREIKIYKSTFKGNYSTHLGVRRSSDVLVEGCIFEDSLDTGSGGQVALSGKNVLFKNNFIKKSTSGVYAIRSYTESLPTNITIDNNSIDVPNGHVFRVEGGLFNRLTISNNTINGNSTNIISGQSNTAYPNIGFYDNIFNISSNGFFQNPTGTTYNNMRLVGNYFMGNTGVMNIRSGYDFIDIIDNTFIGATSTLLGISGGKNTLISGNVFRNNISSRIIYGTMDSSFIVKKNTFINNITSNEDVYVGSDITSSVVEDNTFLHDEGDGNKALTILGLTNRAINNNTVIGYDINSTIVASLSQHGNVENGIDLSVATNNRSGVVRRSNIVTIINTPDAENAEPSVITDFDEATLAHDDLVDKINSLVLLANRCKQAINAKLNADINSGQQTPQA